MLTPNDLVNSYDAKIAPVNNFQRWLHYTKAVESPNSYIVFGLISAVSAALQRRVWIPHGIVRCYPNTFITLVGKASLGKGMAIGPVKALIEDFKYTSTYETNVFKEVSSKDEEEKVPVSSVDGGFEDDALILLPAESSSLRSLTHYLSKNPRFCYYVDSTTKPPRKRPYMHSSCFLLLAELVSLLKSGHETINMVNFLVDAWDSRDKYKHATFGYGTDDIRNLCVTILAGTTPDSMEGLFTEDLLREGIASRSIFVYEEEPRFRKWPDGGLSASQLEALKSLRGHIYNITRLMGEVRFSLEAEELIKNWYEKELAEDRVNFNIKLDPYYGRKKVHLMKLAMAVHFIDSLSMEISKDELIIAMDLLKSIEINMHRALRSKNRNELSGPAYKVLSYLKQKGIVSLNQLFGDFFETFKSREELQQTVNNLKLIGKVEEIPGSPVKFKRKGI